MPRRTALPLIVTLTLVLTLTIVPGCAPAEATPTPPAVGTPVETPTAEVPLVTPTPEEVLPTPTPEEAATPTPETAVTPTPEEAVTPTPEEPAETPTPEELVDMTDEELAAELWQMLQDAGYQDNWSLHPKGALYTGIEPHGALISLYLSPEAEPVLTSPQGEMPADSILVKENYTPDETLAALTVMQKLDGYNPDHGDWFWAAFSPEGEVQAAGQVESCISCHGAVWSNDYVFTMLVNPIDVDEVEATDEDMATAEELWQLMQDADYQANWETTPKGTLYEGQPPHGALLSTYLSEEAAEAMANQTAPMPAEAIIVKENYSEDEELVNTTVMAKVEGYDPEHGDWFWATFDVDGAVLRAGKDAYCISCHGGVSSNDFIFTFPLNLIDASGPPPTPTPPPS